MWFNFRKLDNQGHVPMGHVRHHLDLFTKVVCKCPFQGLRSHTDVLTVLNQHFSKCSVRCYDISGKTLTQTNEMYFLLRCYNPSVLMFTVNV